MNKKDLGLLILIIVVGTVVAIINPRFLSTINIANTANLVDLFGLFTIGQSFVIITGGIELSSGSVIALLGVIFIDLIANRGVPWPIAALIVLALGFVMGFVHALLITRLRMQPFVVTLCGLLIYRGVARFYTADGTAGFPSPLDLAQLRRSHPPVGFSRTRSLRHGRACPGHPRLPARCAKRRGCPARGRA